MSNVIRIAVAAAVVVVAAIVGFNYVNNSVGSDQPSPTPTPTATPRPASLPASGALDPGTYVMPSAVTPVEFNFSVPAGWATDTDRFISKHRREPGELAFSVWEVTHVFGNGCQTEGSLIEVGPTVDDLANALATQQGRETAGPTDTMLGGYPAKRVELSVPADWDTAGCEVIRNWADIGGSLDGGWSSRPGQTDVIYVLEVAGKRLVINTWRFEDTSAADITELEGIIASIRFEP